MTKLSMSNTSLFPVTVPTVGARPPAGFTLPREMEKIVSAMNREWVGVERNMNRYFQDSPLNTSNYPPYNIEKLDDDNYSITIAIAGFGKENVEITVEDSLLVIKGEQEWEDNMDLEKDKNYLYKGIANRDFLLRYTLDDYIKVVEATFENGLLCLALQREVPEEMKPQTIKIK